MNNMRLLKSALATLMLSAALSVSHTAFADIVISGTRVIYPESAKDVTVNMENRGNKPLLVQTWLDDGRDSTDPRELKVPFVVTPPVSRIDPAKGQTVRISWLGQAMPQNKETMYWFNVLEIPPKAKNDSAENILQLAFRTRIKMFFRPKGLKGDPAIAAKELKWTQNGSMLVARNDSPYYVSLAKIDASVGGKKIAIDPHYVEPFGSQSYALKESGTAHVSKVAFTAINDFGGADVHEVTLK
ncbi:MULTISPECIES: fimbrial chaperone [Enterobacter]|uniref:Fimbrial chaperone n=1 Tax=Enterobacter cloacae complex sp. Mu1197 TaxID=3152302 RepID=A0AAU7FYU4_9ENTR|nr:fimbrial chaperone [Enterobacter quasiroggenkampii]